MNPVDPEKYCILDLTELPIGTTNLAFQISIAPEERQHVIESGTILIPLEVIKTPDNKLYLTTEL